MTQAAECTRQVRVVGDLVGVGAPRPGDGLQDQRVADALRRSPIWWMSSSIVAVAIGSRAEQGSSMSKTSAQGEALGAVALQGDRRRAADLPVTVPSRLGDERDLLISRILHRGGRRAVGGAAARTR
ncbi:MAG: hypothetical protein HYY06_15425 [Deltaproteobacteria bacterium]|nr:hypothetical protein [Deltaproteobacteria bacterium]